MNYQTLQVFRDNETTNVKLQIRQINRARTLVVTKKSIGKFYAREKSALRRAAAYKIPHVVQAYFLKDCTIEMNAGICNLQDIMTRPFNGKETVHLFMPIYGAVNALHRVGVAHRDIKPENVVIFGSPLDWPKDPSFAERCHVDMKRNMIDLFTENPRWISPESVKLIDFGLSHVSIEALPLTGRTARARVGSPYYAAPELITGPFVVEGERVEYTGEDSMGNTLVRTACGSTVRCRRATKSAPTIVVKNAFTAAFDVLAEQTRCVAVPLKIPGNVEATDGLVYENRAIPATYKASAVDLFSLSMLLWNMHMGSLPHATLHSVQLEQAVGEESLYLGHIIRDAYSRGISPSLAMAKALQQLQRLNGSMACIIDLLMHPDPEKRIAGHRFCLHQHLKQLCGGE